ncbi:MAG: PAS domain-containing protein [Lachnospiraceae bacterium]|nr:PAS domain-containing protein [Lachnospiraceae bacterium]
MYRGKTTGKVKLSLEDLTKVAQEMPGGLLIYKADETEEIIFLNDIVLYIFGCDTQEEFAELTGGTFKGMVHPSDVENVRESITAQIDSDVSHFGHVEYRIIRKDGSEGIVDDFGRLVETEEYGNVYYVFIQDVTENREIKAKNQKMEMELERERGIAELKDEFLFNISHDIRTPMNAVMGFMELAMKHADSPEKVRDDLTRAKEAGRHMMSLIEDLLEMGSIHDNSVYIKFEETDL